MSNPTTIRLYDEDLLFLRDLSKQERTDKTRLIKEIIHNGIKKLKIENKINLLIKNRDKELNFRANKTKEYIANFSIKEKGIAELKKKLEELKIPSTIIHELLPEEKKEEPKK